MADQKTGSLLKTIKDTMMGREKDKKLRRRRRRQQKLRKLKYRFTQAKNDSERRKLVEKIQRISISNKYVPKI
jgi:hypothetical protein